MSTSKKHALASWLAVHPSTIRVSKRDSCLLRHKRQVYLVLSPQDRLERLKHCLHRVPLSLLSRHVITSLTPVALNALNNWTKAQGSKINPILLALIKDFDAFSREVEFGPVLATFDAAERWVDGFHIYRTK